MTPWDKLSGEVRGALKGNDSLELAFNAGHAAGLAEAKSEAGRAEAVALLRAWDGSPHRSVCLRHATSHSIVATATANCRAVAVAHGECNDDARHWLAYRLGLCERPGAPF